MITTEQRLVQDVAKLFSRNHRVILDRWLQMLDRRQLASNEVEREHFESGFSQLVTDFIDFLPDGKFDDYYAGNAVIAKKIASNDISYSKFVLAFHLFEESYTSLLVDEFKAEDLPDYLIALDHIHHVSIAIVSEAYFEIKDVTVLALAKLVELRDPNTFQHLDTTRHYSAILARAIKMDETFVDSLFRAGALHDIGKVAIPDRVLLKDGALTPEERLEMQQHPIIGASVIDGIIGDRHVTTGYLRLAREIVLYHHEKFDGSGYPEGLSGEDIPISARIFALADAYDAMVSKRTYKDALSHEEAVERIREDSGKHFDPDIVTAFLKVHKRFEMFKHESQPYTEQYQPVLTR